MRSTITAILATIFTFIAMPLPATAGEWGVGIAVARNQPPQEGAEHELAVVPFPVYQGERLDVGLGTIRFALLQSRSFTLSLGGQVRFDGYDPDKSDALDGMEERKPSFDVGLGIATGGSWGVAELNVLGDATGTHKGSEITAVYRYPILGKHWMLEPAVGLSWQSDDLVDYYYGVQANEARVDRPAYNGHSATSAFVEISAAYQVASRWQVLGGIKYVHLGDNIKASPVIDRAYEVSVFSGLLYRF